MSPKISADLAAQLVAFPAGVTRVLVTLQTPARESDLVAAGLRAVRVFAEGQLAIGDASAETVVRLADWPGVERIEADGEVRALRP